MTTLASAVAIGHNQLLIDAPMTVGQIPGWVKIDDELLFAGGQHFRTGTTLVLSAPTTATHSSGATVTYAGRPYDAAFLAATGGAGAGGVTVDNQVDAPAVVTTLIAPGAVIDGAEATLGKWTVVSAAEATDVDFSTSVTASGTNSVAIVDRIATGTGDAIARANTTVTAAADGEAITTVTSTGIEDALATTAAASAGGSADVSVAATGGNSAFANSEALATEGQAQAKSTATSEQAGGASVVSEVNSQDGLADASSLAFALGSGNATVDNGADVAGAGLARASLTATGTAGTSGVVVLADATSARMGFYGATPIAIPEIPASPTEQDIADVLVALGLATQAA